MPQAPGGDGAIELAFISPEVGARYRERLDQLGSEISWRLEVAATPNGNAILEKTRELLRPLGLRKGPSYFPGERKVRAVLAALLPPETIEPIQARFLEETGFELEIRAR